MNVLFVCNQNLHRSATAAEIFKKEFTTQSAGLYSEPAITREEMSWADLIIVMEDFQRTELSRRFPKLYLQKRILSLDIPDFYGYMQPELITLLHTKMENLLEPPL